MANRETDQPLPTDPVGECVQDDLIRAFEESKRIGIERYGQPLHTFNGRDAGRDATEELVDLFVYLRQLRLEHAALRAIVLEVKEHHRCPQFTLEPCRVCVATAAVKP